jgi:hypothetical protein
VASLLGTECPRFSDESTDDIGMTRSLIISNVQKYGDTNIYGYAVVSLSALTSQGLF